MSSTDESTLRLQGMVARSRGRVMWSLRPPASSRSADAVYSYEAYVPEALTRTPPTSFAPQVVTVTTLCPGATARFLQGRRGQTKRSAAEMRRRGGRAHRLSRLKAGRRVVITGMLNTFSGDRCQVGADSITLPDRQRPECHAADFTYISAWRTTRRI